MWSLRKFSRLLKVPCEEFASIKMNKVLEELMLFNKF